MKRVFVIKENGKLNLVEGISDKRPDNFVAVAPPNFVVSDVEFVKEIDGKIFFDHAALVRKDKKDCEKDIWNNSSFIKRIKRAYGVR